MRSSFAEQLAEQMYLQPLQLLLHSPIPLALGFSISS